MFDAPKLLKLLTDHKVEFVVIGGLAMVTHGSAYVTKDLDVCYNRNRSNMDAVASAMAEIHPTLRGAPEGLPFRFDAPTIQAGLNFTLNTDLGPVDFLGEVAGVGGYAQAWELSAWHTIYGITVRVLSIDGLIAAKRAAGRPRDVNHLLELEELKKLSDLGN